MDAQKCGSVVLKQKIFGVLERDFFFLFQSDVCLPLDAKALEKVLACQKLKGSK